MAAVVAGVPGIELATILLTVSLSSTASRATASWCVFRPSLAAATSALFRRRHLVVPEMPRAGGCCGGGGGGGYSCGGGQNCGDGGLGRLLAPFCCLRLAAGGRIRFGGRRYWRQLALGRVSRRRFYGSSPVLPAPCQAGDVGLVGQLQGWLRHRRRTVGQLGDRRQRLGRRCHPLGQVAVGQDNCPLLLPSARLQPAKEKETSQSAIILKLSRLAINTHPATNDSVIFFLKYLVSYCAG